MSARVLIDIPALSERIKVIAKSYKPSPDAPNRDRESDIVRGVIRDLIIRNISREASYWAEAGVRMVAPAEFEKCFERIRQAANAKVLGQGAFGKFINVSVDPCIKGLPKGLKRVGIKMEYLKHDYNPSQNPTNVSKAVRIAKKAAKLGIGPQLYDVFVAKDMKDRIMIVKVSEIINGKTWADTEWETPEKKHEAAKQLEAHVHKMNEAGIIHHDLHSGNVMVDVSGRVYIIDYDLAKFSQEEEVGVMPNFNDTYNSPWEPKGVASDDGVEYVYNKLIEEGSIKLTVAKPKNKTRKNNR